MVRLAILASGTGSNAARLMDHFRSHPLVEVVIVGSDRPGAGVLERAWERGVQARLFSAAELKDGIVERDLVALHVDLIVLAGFLRLIPAPLVRTYAGRIVNIHPSLLPAHGGKGMYGQRVHEAVLAAGEEQSGITIHLVNERYDEGEHLLQVTCPVLKDDTPDTLAARIHTLEHAHYPAVVDDLCRELGPMLR